MAIIVRGHSKCPICGHILAEDQALFATSGSVFPPEDPLWRYGDAGLHWDCYAVWPHRHRFARQIVETRADYSPRDPYWADLHLDDDCFLEISVQTALVRLWLSDTGSHIDIPSAEWGVPLDLADRHPLVQGAAETVMPRLLTRFPNPDSFEPLIDRDAKAALAAEFQAQLARESQERDAKLALYNDSFDEVFCRQPCCPKCSAPWDRLRYYDNRNTHRRSMVICQDCGRSSHLDESRLA